MGMTMTQKILAAHCGEAAVTAGQLINAQLDIVLGNDITTPVAINEFEKDLQAPMGEVAFNGKALGTSYSQTPTTARRVTLTAGMGDVVLTTTE